MLSDSELELLRTVNALLSGNGVAALTDAHWIAWNSRDQALLAAIQRASLPYSVDGDGSNTPSSGGTDSYR